MGEQKIFRREQGHINGLGSQTRGKGTRHLPYPEYVRRRDKGLCYHCGLAFGTGHRCPEKSLRVVILAEDEELNDAGEIVALETETGEEEPVDKGTPEASCQWLELSLCSARGLTQAQTMKLRGLVQGKDVVILIDSEASHNLISIKLVNRLGMAVDHTTSYAVRLGDGHQRKTREL